MCKVHTEWTKKKPENTQKKGREVTLNFFFFFWVNQGTIEGTKLIIRLNILLSCDPAVTIPGIYSNELKIYAHAKTCT